MFVKLKKVLCCKFKVWKANTVDPDETAHYVPSHIWINSVCKFSFCCSWHFKGKILVQLLPIHWLSLRSPKKGTNLLEHLLWDFFYASILTNFNGALLTAYLYLLNPIATARKRERTDPGTSMYRVDSELFKRLRGNLTKDSHVTAQAHHYFSVREKENIRKFSSRILWISTSCLWVLISSVPYLCYCISYYFYMGLYHWNLWISLVLSSFSLCLVTFGNFIVGVARRLR